MSMTSQRRDPQPVAHGWELALIALVAVATLLALAALAGFGLASLAAGDGWIWPHDTAAAGRILAGLAHGHPTAGLPAGQVTRIPGPAVVYAAVAVVEVLTITAAVAAGLLVARQVRPGGPGQGMATRTEAAQILGIGALRRARAVVRPDTDGPRPTATPPAATPTWAGLGEGR